MVTSATTRSLRRRLLVRGHDPESRTRLNPLQKLALAVEIYATYASMRLLLRLRGLPGALAALRRPLARTAQPDVGASTSLISGLRLGSAVARSLPLLPTEHRCLMQSLVLVGLLARRGLAGQLVIAVRPGGESGGRFGAHAWVELDERPLLPTFEGGFTRLTAI